MTQQERLAFLIKHLITENTEYPQLEIPDSIPRQKQMLRSLMNIRLPKPISKEFLKIQDAYLKEELKDKGIVPLSELTAISSGLYLWQGDITTLQIDAIVNAANSAMLGCFVPCHGCIDNAIHSAAGIQLRSECYELMEKQGEEEKTGTAKITKAYNLPCRYVLHTVGPIIQEALRKEEDCIQLASCYRSCLELAAAYHLKSIAFCCISTGEFHFPNETAAEIAIDTVEKYRKESQSKMEVVFNVFKETDREIYQRLLKTNRTVSSVHFEN